jgi:hypothetical protein
MATRNLLARTHLPAFRAWLAERGWMEQPTKGRYEVGRWTHPTEKPLILFARETATVHVTVQEKDWRVIRAFIRDHHARKATTT